jgi:hypothetical protein
MHESGLLGIVVDRVGREAYAPTARIEASFVEQVSSLFAADYLAHPKDYEHVTSCASCGEIPLNGRIRHAKACVRPPMESGVSLTEAARASVRMTAWPPAPRSVPSLRIAR